MSFVCGRTDRVQTGNRSLKDNLFLKLRCSHLVRRPRLPLPVLQLLGVLLPDGEDPVVAAKVVPTRRLAVLLSDWAEIKGALNIYQDE